MVITVSTRTALRITIHLRIRETRVATEDTEATATEEAVSIDLVKASTMMASVEPKSSSSRLRVRSVPKRSRIKAGLRSAASLRLEEKSR